MKNLTFALTFLFLVNLAPSLSFAANLAKGYVNGDGKINIQDVVMVMQHVLNLHTLTTEQLSAADVTGDGDINVVDVTSIMRFSLGLIASFDGEFKLGSEVLMDKMLHLVRNKKVGLVTNQSGVNSRGVSTIDLLHEAEDIELVALYGPEHGIDGTAKAGVYVESYVHPELGIPVYSLYGATRMPTEDMLKGIDVLLYDIQDIGARSYTYVSTLNYCMQAAAKYNLPVVVLDRP
ncbi:MAG: DUF1343 domain-containing protein, partial [Dethiobacteria bacterium]|nr:DUF1343 domain-containing protein [Dethiobacteria bacterium]